MEEEIWKDIPGYEGSYQVSNLGRVKSLDRYITYKNGKSYFYKGRVLKQNFRGEYLCTKLSKDNKDKIYSTHKLVAITFLNHIPNGHFSVIDHIDDNKLNNSVDNLFICSSRYNTHKHISKLKKTSNYIGVCKKGKKWISRISIDNKRKHLGNFDNEYEAHLAYQKALEELKRKP